MIRIKRAINGVTINGDEYLLDEKGKVMQFDYTADAKKFLREAGFNKVAIEKKYYFTFESFEEIDGHNLSERIKVRITKLSDKELAEIATQVLKKDVVVIGKDLFEIV